MCSGGLCDILKQKETARVFYTGGLYLVGVGQERFGREVSNEGLAAGEHDLVALIIKVNGGAFEVLTYPVAGNVAAADEDVGIALAHGLHHGHDLVAVSIFVGNALDDELIMEQLYEEDEEIDN